MRQPLIETRSKAAPTDGREIRRFALASSLARGPSAGRRRYARDATRLGRAPVGRGLKDRFLPLRKRLRNGPCLAQRRNATSPAFRWVGQRARNAPPCGALPSGLVSSTLTCGSIHRFAEPPSLPQQPLRLPLASSVVNENPIKIRHCPFLHSLDAEDYFAGALVPRSHPPCAGPAAPPSWARAEPMGVFSIRGFGPGIQYARGAPVK